MKIKKQSRTFMPEILSPGTGLSPLTDRSILPTHNVHTIQDVLSGDPYKVPDAGGHWGKGEDQFHSYKEDGDLYKRRERDMEIFHKMVDENSSEFGEKWKVKVPGGSKILPSFQSVQNFREKMQQKGIPIQWVEKIANQKSRTETISDSLNRTFKIESDDIYRNVRESGAGFCVSQGYFITCAHVIINYNKNVETQLDVEDYSGRLSINIVGGGRRIKAKLISLNAILDLAIIQADIDVPPLILDTHSVQIGDEILTVGSPYGFDNNISFGNVGSMGRQIYPQKNSPRYMFVDAPVFKGNSGGPIVKISNGHVVGMLTAIVARNGEYGLNVGLPSLYIKNYCIENNIDV